MAGLETRDVFRKSDSVFAHGIPDNSTYECNVLYSNHSQFKLLPGTFGGIPENLILNVICWLVLLIMFTFLRKRAWDYGRLALVQKNDQRWTQLFYGEGSRLSIEETSIDSVESALHQDKGICSWIKALFQIRNEQILKRNGPDALQYLSFQRHIIVYLLIVCAVSLVVILPINIQGQLEADGDFGRTTLSNLDPESRLIWIHIAFSFLFVPLGIALMRHFSSNLKLEDDDDLISRTLMISKIPKNHCHRSILLQHFQEAYIECIVQDVELAFDVKKLSDLDRRRETAAHARLYCENLLKETGERPRMRPYRCGRICICPQCPQVDALEYYTEEEQALSAAVDREKSVSLLKPLGIAFVTFQNESMAEIVYKDHQKSCKCVVNPLASSKTRQLKPHRWVIDFAPPPEDIYWENLSVITSLWYFKATIINLALFLLFFFVTTPTVIWKFCLYLFNLVAVEDLFKRTPFLSDFLSTLALLVISVILPVIVRYSDQFMSHWTRSTRNHSIMVKTYIFLLFMVVILPLLQLTSVKAFLFWTLNKGETYRWKCVFISGNGAFFVNYVITASFIGTALELIRFPELLMYLFYMCFSRSAAEQAGLRKAVLWEFEFGVQYAWFLLIFSVIIIYSLVVPLIAPFGVFCLCMKHCIDRYNIFFVYGPSKINRNIHATAINFVVIALIVMQICMFFFLFLRNGWSKMSIVSIGICIFTTMVFMTQISFNWFRVLSPITYKKLNRRPSASQNDQSQISPAITDTKPFVPLVLKRSSSKNEVFSTSIQERSYGTNEDSITSTPDEDEENVVVKREAKTRKTYQRF